MRIILAPRQPARGSSLTF